MWCIPPLSSGGLIVSYQCSNQCRHCLYASSPEWQKWITETDATAILKGIQKHNRYLTGLHIGGGEPLLKPELVAWIVRQIVALRLPLEYVETNAFWCHNDSRTETVFRMLQEAGIPAVLVSVSPFHLEFVPPERVLRAIRIGRQVFGPNGLHVYTSYFLNQFQDLPLSQPLPLEDYLDAVGRENASLAFATEYGLIPNGRVPVLLSALYQGRQASAYTNETCRRELESPHHVHIDLDGHYIAGLCAGLSLGDGRDLDTLYGAGVDLTDRPVLTHLLEGGVEALFLWAVETFGYVERPEGYIAKCHLCLDIRRYLVRSDVQFPELAPRQFYVQLDKDEDRGCALRPVTDFEADMPDTMRRGDVR